jgi:hypothetical protein
MQLCSKHLRAWGQRVCLLGWRGAFVYWVGAERGGSAFVYWVGAERGGSAFVYGELARMDTVISVPDARVDVWLQPMVTNTHAPTQITLA